MNVLVLDSSFYPIRIIDWRRAMTLLFSNRIEVIEEYEDRVIKTPSTEYALPKVIRVISSFKRKKFVKFSRENVFYRDSFKCQYCTNVFKKSDLTLDHVMPRSRGGATDWENIVSACAPCNNKKANRTPKEARMKIYKRPVEPTGISMMVKKFSRLDENSFGHWLFQSAS